MKTLTAIHGETCIVDDDVYEWASQIRWCVSGGYFKCSSGRHKHKYLHRMIIGEIPEGFETDHINRNKFDNRRENLRIVTHAINMRNNAAKNVFYEVRKCRWVARLRRDYKFIRLGTYKTEEEALEVVRKFKEGELE
jgi:hypothetical protein